MKSNRLKSLAVSAIIVLGIILIHSCTKTPVPAFTTEPSVNPEAGDSISFLNTSVDATTYEWDFGDGYSSTDMEPTNIYVESGSYDVTLTASNEKKSEMLTQTLVINEPTVLALYIYEYDSITPIEDCEVWLYESEDDWRNNYLEPYREAYSDSDGLAIFLNLEDEEYVVDLYKKTETGSWQAAYFLSALYLNENNFFDPLGCWFVEDEAGKSLERSAAKNNTVILSRAIRK